MNIFFCFVRKSQNFIIFERMAQTPPKKTSVLETSKKTSSPPPPPPLIYDDDYDPQVGDLVEVFRSADSEGAYSWIGVISEKQPITPGEEQQYKVCLQCIDPNVQYLRPRSLIRPVSQKSIMSIPKMKINFTRNTAVFQRSLQWDQSMRRSLTALHHTDVKVSFINNEGVEHSIQVHRFILETHSAYFRSLLSEQWKQDPKIEIHGPFTDTMVFDSIIQFLYTGRMLSFPSDILIDIIFWADYLCIESLTSFIQSQDLKTFFINNQLYRWISLDESLWCQNKTKGSLYELVLEKLALFFQNARWDKPVEYSNEQLIKMAEWLLTREETTLKDEEDLYTMMYNTGLSINTDKLNMIEPLLCKHIRWHLMSDHVLVNDVSLLTRAQIGEILFFKNSTHQEQWIDTHPQFQKKARINISASK